MNVIPTEPSDQRGIIILNVFTVRPENQQRLIDCIRGAGDPADLPGLRAMHLLRSLDGTKVVNRMQWESQAAFRQATANSPEVAATMKQVAELVEDATPGLYEIVDVGP